MKTYTVRELNTKLGVILREAERDGVIISRYRRPVLRILPIVTKKVATMGDKVATLPEGSYKEKTPVKMLFKPGRKSL